MKNKYQPIHFSSLEDFLDFLPGDQLNVTHHLRNIVMESIPQCREKLSYNVPYYYRHSRICFIWPGAVPWGKTTTGVTFGFCNGHLLTDDTGYLEKGSRKQVFTKIYHDVREIDPDILRAFLYEAAEIDNSLWRKKTL